MSCIGVLNGYYRSGTTYLWKCLNKVSDVTTYYEPLNIKMKDFLYIKPEKNKLHNTTLWENYYNLNENDKQTILSKLNHYDKFDSNWVHDYLKTFEYMNDNVILQTNRYDEILDEHKDVYVHIIRNFSDVFQSFKVIYKKHPFKRRVLFKIKEIFGFESFFKNMWLINEYVKKNNIFSIDLEHITSIQMHFLSWFTFNYKIIEQLSEDHIILYEQISTNPSSVELKVKKIFDVNLKVDDFKFDKKYLSNYYNTQIDKILIKLELKEQYLSFLKKINRFDDYENFKQD